MWTNDDTFCSICTCDDTGYYKCTNVDTVIASLGTVTTDNCEDLTSDDNPNYQASSYLTVFVLPRVTVKDSKNFLLKLVYLTTASKKATYGK